MKQPGQGLQPIPQPPPVLRQQPARRVQQLIQRFVHGQDGQQVRRGGPEFLELHLVEAAEARQPIPWVHGAQSLPSGLSAGARLDQSDRFRKFKGVQFRVHGSLQSSVLSPQS